MSAEWISPANELNSGAFTIFQQNFELKECGEIRLKYAANGSLNIFIDGNQVVRDYNLDTFSYNSAELFLETGSHTIDIELNSCLTYPMLWLELAIGEEFLFSDANWRVTKNLAYIDSYCYDANFKSSPEWGAVKVVNQKSPTPKLIPDVEYYQKLECKIISQGGLQCSDSDYTFFTQPPFRIFQNVLQNSFAQNMSGFPWCFKPNCSDWDGFFVEVDFQKEWHGELDMEWELPAGTRIDIAIDGEFKGRYIATAGEQKWSFPWLFEGRYLKLSLVLGGMGEAKISNIEARPRHAMLPEPVNFGVDNVDLMKRICQEASDLELFFAKLNGNYDFSKLGDFRSKLWSANYLWGSAKWSEVLLSLLGEYLADNYQENMSLAVNWVTALCEDYLFYGRGDIYGRFEAIADKIVKNSLDITHKDIEIYEMWTILSWVLVDDNLKKGAADLKIQLDNPELNSPTTKGIAANFFANVIGLKPLEPGFREFEFAPNVADIEQLFGEVHTPLGLIKVDMRTTHSGMIVDITGPSILKMVFKREKKIVACYWNGELIVD